MQTLCSTEMTAIEDETIDKPEDNPIINSCLGEIDMQNSTNMTGITGIFLHAHITNNSRPINTILYKLYLNSLQLAANQILLIRLLLKRNAWGTYSILTEMISTTLYMNVKHI